MENMENKEQDYTQMRIQEYQQNLIDEVMDNFDFERVHTVMEFLDWKWATSDNTEGVPYISEIKKMARNLMKESIKQAMINDTKKSAIATGGFEVSYDETERFLSLKFVLDDWDAYPEE